MNQVENSDLCLLSCEMAIPGLMTSAITTNLSDSEIDALGEFLLARKNKPRPFRTRNPGPFRRYRVGLLARLH